MKRKLIIGDDWFYDESPLLVRDILVPEEESTFTGLYDKDGSPLHREKEPIGFRVR